MASGAVAESFSNVAVVAADVALITVVVIIIKRTGIKLFG
jgi:hypothetical protein